MPSSLQQCSSSPISLRRGVGRERRLARARESEEQRHVASLALVGRAVHAEHALLGHQVVHQREDAFFHFAGVLRAQDHELAALEAEADAGRGGEARRSPDRPAACPAL